MMSLRKFGRTSSTAERDRGPCLSWFVIQTVLLGARLCTLPRPSLLLAWREKPSVCFTPHAMHEFLRAPAGASEQDGSTLTVNVATMQPPSRRHRGDTDALGNACRSRQQALIVISTAMARCGLHVRHHRQATCWVVHAPSSHPSLPSTLLRRMLRSPAVCKSPDCGVSADTPLRGHP